MIDANTKKLQSKLVRPLVRACRNAIEFNQIPSIGNLVPGGIDAMKLDVLLAVPPRYQKDLDITAIKSAFPYTVALEYRFKMEV